MTSVRGPLMWLRARMVPVSLLATAVLGVTSWWAVQGLSRLPGADQPEGRAPVVYWLSVLLVAAWSVGLTSPTTEVDRTCVRSQPALSCVHLLIAAGASVLGLALVVPSDGATFGWLAGVRSVLGFLGLTALLSRWIPDTALWSVPTVSGLAWGFASSPFQPSLLDTVLFWPKQPGGLLTSTGGPDLSWAVAVAAFVAALFVGNDGFPPCTGDHRATRDALDRAPIAAAWCRRRPPRRPCEAPIRETSDG